MILGRVRPSIYLPTLAILWGVAAACQGACQNWHQIVGLRFLIGFFESGFAPGCAFYLSSWYRKYELASRYAWLYTSVAVAGAVSGLLAGVITEFMDGAAGIAGWRWLFVSTVLSCSENCNKFLVADISHSDHRRRGLLRYWRDCHVRHARLPNLYQQQIPHQGRAHPGLQSTCDRRHGSRPGRSEEGWRVDGSEDDSQGLANVVPLLPVCHGNWQPDHSVLYSLASGNIWMEGSLRSMYAPLAVLTVPTPLANCIPDMTIPGYAFAVVCILVGCFTADWLKTIWPVLTIMSGSGFVFFVATTAATNGMVRYVLGIFAFGTIYGCSPLTKTWISHVLSHPSEKRAVAIALINALGNGSSIYGSFLWPDKDSPRFTPGFA